jgi:hypothetical protein
MLDHTTGSHAIHNIPVGRTEDGVTGVLRRGECHRFTPSALHPINPDASVKSLSFPATSCLFWPPEHGHRHWHLQWRKGTSGGRQLAGHLGILYTHFSC